MKKLIIAMFVISMTGVALAQSNREPLITTSLTGKSIQKIYARTSGGSITVTGGSSEPRLEVYARHSNSSNMLPNDEIKRIIDRYYDLEIKTDNNLLSVTARAKERNLDRRNQLSISFKISVPQNVNTDLSTSGGSITLAGLSGAQQFSTSGGSLNLDKITGRINGKTSGGSIVVKNSGDNIDMETSGGSIRADNCTGNIVLSTSGGSLNLNNLKGVINARTSGGSINGNTINGELITHTSGGKINLDDIRASVEASTSGGGMNVSLKEVGKYVKLNTSGGSIDLEMPGNKGLTLALRGNKISTSGLNDFNGSKSDRSITATYKGGGIPVNVNANGHLSFTLR